MLKSIQLDGIGPHESITFNFADPMASNAIVGESEAGKSTIIDGIAFVLWGADRSGKPIDLREMRDGHQVMSGRLELVSGTFIERTLHRSKTGGRGETTRSIGGAPHKTEKTFLGALGALGQNVPALRQVLVPFAWLPLVEGAGNGRPFRDILASILPASDKVAIVKELMEVAGLAFVKGDSVHEADAKEQRAHSNRQQAKAEGDVERLVQLVALRKEQEAITIPDLAIPAGVIGDDNEWCGYIAAKASHDQAEERIAAAERNACAWDSRLSALGERPETTDDAEAEAKRLYDAARLAQSLAAEELETIRQTGGDLTVTLKDLEASPIRDAVLSRAVEIADREYTDATEGLAAASSMCPTCQRDGWDGALDAATARQEAASEASAAADQALVEDSAVRAATCGQAKRDTSLALDSAREAYATQAAHLASLTETTTLAQASLATAKASSAPRVDWDRAHCALGDKPTVPAREPAPAIPRCNRPNASAVDAAAKTIAEADKAEGARGQRSDDLGSLQSTLAESETALATLTAECARLDGLVDCVRRAPSESARREIGALGDLGPVTIELREDGGADVLIDGRPHFLASTGKRVVADAWLRAGLRRALGIAWLPMIIDCVQDVRGQEIPDCAPSISLETTDGAIAVRQ